MLKGNSPKKTTRHPDGNIIFSDPQSAEEILALQRENKFRTILLQDIPDHRMGDFHYMDGAKDIWMAIKVRFVGNEESKRMRRSMLK